MKINIPKKVENTQTLMRTIGYNPSSNRYQEESFVRRASDATFPRFHIYVKNEEGMWILDLHLDQRKSSHEGSRAHGGEHTGSVVEQEAKRIKNILV